MASNLVIVESPAKVKTIKKFLGSNYIVDASNGHVRDLPKSQLGIDVEHGYEPKYITIRGKGDVLAKLRKEVKKADKIYLATDPDREGEAISWHLMKALKLDETDKKVCRITFNEITKNAVRESLKHPRELDMDLVDAQQTRRILDRMVGYRISPLLWAKVKRGLSAGRVQSVALRMICDREAEIEAFIPQEYWSLEAELLPEGMKKPLTAKYYGKDGVKAELKTEADCLAVIADCGRQEFTVQEIRRNERIRRAPLPFTTSTLQQEASKTLNFSTQKTMRIAQQLYEGVEIKGRGTIALITYLRTDSTRVAEEADSAARQYIAEHFGENYVAEQQRSAKGQQKIQDAHEAIRPVNMQLSPAEVKPSLSRDQFRLYQLIWKRFTASRMKPAVYATISVKTGCAGHSFQLSGSSLKFPGFMDVYTDGEEEKNSANAALSKLLEGQKLKKIAFQKEQHFTQPPAHYTEASLVKAMEEQGIGRPSTYAPTITTILARRYVTKEQKNLYVTELGQVVNRMMVDSFPAVVDPSFTANLEQLLDSVGEGKTAWKTVVENFYPDLDEAVQRAEKTLESVKIADEESDELCELCGRRMVIKYGPHGKFLACPGFPDCRNTKPYFEKIGVKCPKCGRELVLKRSKKGRIYYGCENSPDCDFMSWARPVAKPCPVCGSYMVLRGSRHLCSNTACGHSENAASEE
ncbi:DNA topoisomerase-1 [Fusobacterium naviforme]|nr:type I DNA topoisomerase [Fusobacterium naviforme]PSL10237.1 DNA topoisomerase-1 [Fusobacterium naviforme]STO27647.1 DNA topoisomerase 1 [Fusobacterium naviforme]